MKAKLLTKRVLSVLLATVMLFSCWVFTAPQADAAYTNVNAGNYTITVDGICKDDAYASGMEVKVYYKPNNGTDTETSKTIYSRSDNFTWDGTGNDDRNNVSISGFPTKVEYKVNKRFSTGYLELYCDIYINGTHVGTTNTEWYLKSGWHTWTWNCDTSKYPKASSITGFDCTNLTIDKDDATVTPTGPTAIKDQYGVVIASSNISGFKVEKTAYKYDSSSGANAANDISINASTGAVTKGSNGYIANGHQTHYLNLRCSASFNGGTVTADKAIILTYKALTATWKYFTSPSGAANTSTTSTVYFGDTPTAKTGLTDHYYTSSKHYTDGKFSTERMTADKTFTMAYTEANHSMVYNASGSKTATTHATKCSCGYTSTENHKWSGWSDKKDDANHKRTCTVCSFEATAAHTYDTDPTYTKISDGVDGKHYKVCNETGCGYHKEEGHSWNDGKQTTAPTCTKEGVMTYTCTAKGCGATYTAAISAKGHTWNDGEVTTEPTCSTKGIKTFTCTVCGATRTEEIAINPDNHDYTAQDTTIEGALVSAAKCGQNAVYYYVCKYNHNHIGTTTWENLGTALAHNYGDPTKLAADETYRGTERKAAEYHKQSCLRGDVCSCDKDINDEYEVKYDKHTWTQTYYYAAPENDHSRINTIVLGILQADGMLDAEGKFIDTDKCYRYCTDCGYVEYSSAHNFVGKVTKEATCLTKGEMTYTCSYCNKSYTNEIPVTPHSWARWDGCSEETVSGLNDSVNVIFECTNGCNSYCKSTYNPTTQEYEYDTSVIVDDPTSESLASDDPIITPIFNEHMEYFDGEMEPYQYRERKASLRVRPSEIEDDTQAMRFSGNISAYSIAEKVSFEVNPDKIYDNNELMSLAEIRAKNKADKTAFDDDTVIDFGFVYTQAKYIRSAQKTINYDLLTLDYMGKKNPTTNQDCRIYRMSVVENNKGNGTLSNNWKGFTDCYNYPTEKAGEPDQYTFNLVINVNVKNYQATYCARTYIIYKYHGDIICVYDQPELNETPIHSHDSVYNQAIKNEATGKLPETVVDYLDYKIIKRTIEGKERYIKQSFIDWDWNYKLTNFKEIEQQNP